MHSTTINVRQDIYHQLKQLSAEYEISISYLMQEILKRAYKNLKTNIIRNDSTHYQDRQPEKLNWKCFHIIFSREDFKQNLLCRYNYRISLSKLLFVGFVLFIDEVITKLKQKLNKKIISNNYTTYIMIYWHLIKKELHIFNIQLKKPET